jgi:hypothetical protein
MEDLPTVDGGASTSMEDLARAVDALSLNHKVARVRYQPEFPVRGRIYEGDEWSSESSNDDEDPMWLSIQAQLPPWIRNPGGGDGVSEEGVDARPAAGVVMSGAEESATRTVGRYRTKDGQRFRIGRGFETMFVFCGPGAPVAKQVEVVPLCSSGVRESGASPPSKDDQGKSDKQTSKAVFESKASKTSDGK